jgi:sugar lactone lactonase YvrE
MRGLKSCGIVLLLGLAGSVLSHAQEIDFSTENWQLLNGEFVTHQGRKCLMGSAVLKDSIFESGVIQVDVWMDGNRSYPGVLFRIQSPGNYERVYLRPHRAGLYPDAIQYTPGFNGIDGWQLYNGYGATAGCELPGARWVPVRIEVLGKRARVFVGEGAEPALEIHSLQHGISKGAVSLNGPRNTTAYFSNFQMKAAGDLFFDPPPVEDAPPGMITRWELSQPFLFSRLDMETYPLDNPPAAIEWRTVKTAPSGMVDIARSTRPLPGGPNVILARTHLISDSPVTKKINFGYSDAAAVFLNGRILFSGNSAYQSRDPSFLGIVGLYDAVFAPLEAGKNEFLLVIGESFGGWGFMAQEGDAGLTDPSMEKIWESGKEFRVPETVVYDPESRALIVSNYDGYNRAPGGGQQTLSRIDWESRTIDHAWAKGLNHPTGMALIGDRLWVVETRSVAVVDRKTGNFLRRIPVQGARFLNDIAVDGSGRVYISDSGTGRIYRLKGEKQEVWMEGAAFRRPNGLLVHGEHLLVAANADRTVKQVDLETGETRVLVRLGEGIIDGLESDKQGRIYISQVQGRIFRMDSDGTVKKILDTTVLEQFTANFALIPEEGLLAIPAYAGNRVVVYRIGL